MNQFLATIKDSKYRRIIVPTILGVFALILTAPLLVTLLKTGNLQGRDDISFHLNRILSIADGLKGGQFPVKIYPEALNGFGYASPLFYPDLFLYPFAILTAIGVPLSVSYCLLIFTMLFASGIFYYLFARKIFAMRGATFCALLFMGGHYTYTIAIYMSGIGQAMAATFAPLLLLGIWNLTRENFSRPQILLLAVLGITFSHMLSLLIYGIFLVIVVLIHARKLFPDRKFWIKTAIIFGLYLLLSACYFVPLLEQFSTTTFLQSKPWALLSDYAVSLNHAFFYGEPWLRRSINRYSIGIIGALCLILVFFVRRTSENKRRLNAIYVLIAVILFVQLLVTDLFPWKLLEQTIVSTIQFPFRLLMIPAVLLPITIGLIVRELTWSPLIKCPKIVYSVLASLIVFVNFAYVLMYIPDWNEVNLDENRLHQYVGTGEWLPLYGEMDDIGDFRTLIEDNSFDGTREKYSSTLTFESEGGTYELPLIYYKGYKAYENGKELEVFASDHATVSVKTNGGTVTVRYDGTILQTVSLVVSSVTLVGCVAFELWRKHD